MWAGRIADSFYVDLSLLGMVNAAVRNGTALDLSGWRPEQAKNSFADTTVESIVLEVSHANTRRCGPAPASVSGAPQSSPPMRMVGCKLTARATL